MIPVGCSGSCIWRAVMYIHQLTRAGWYSIYISGRLVRNVPPFGFYIQRAVHYISDLMENIRLTIFPPKRKDDTHQVILLGFTSFGLCISWPGILCWLCCRSLPETLLPTAPDISWCKFWNTDCLILRLQTHRVWTLAGCKGVLYPLLERLLGYRGGELLCS